MVIWIVFTAVDSDVCVDPHRTPHQRVSAASVLVTQEELPILEADAGDP
jgi:hypothetical protein